MTPPLCHLLVSTAAHCSQFITACRLLCSHPARSLPPFPCASPVLSPREKVEVIYSVTVCRRNKRRKQTEPRTRHSDATNNTLYFCGLIHRPGRTLPNSHSSSGLFAAGAHTGVSPTAAPTTPLTTSTVSLTMCIYFTTFHTRWMWLSLAAVLHYLWLVKDFKKGK